MLATSLALLITGASGPIHWIEDDWPRARQKAAQEGKLVAVDVWATWCHSCLSMKHVVLTRPSFRSVAKQHIYLALNFDLPKNAAFFERYPASAFPTFLLIDPKSAQVVARHLGSGTEAEMLSFFRQPPEDDETLRAAEALLAKGKTKAAAQMLSAHLLAHAKSGPSSRAVASWVEAMWQSDRARCAREGPRWLRFTDQSVRGLDAAILVGYCASALPPKEARTTHEAVYEVLRPVVDRPPARLSPDDVSSVFGAAIQTLERLGRAAEAKRLVRRQLKTLEAAAQAAPNGAARATYDAHRLEAYLSLKRFAEAERMLKASEKARPEDFNPPWRLARLYLAWDRPQDALAAIERGLRLGYGGRKLRLYSTKLEALHALGRTERARAVAEEAERWLSSVPAHLVRSGWRKEFDAVRTRPAGPANPN